jgi:hypothetical protein
MLSTDPVEEISAPVLDALVEVLPRILKQRYGVAHKLSTILDADKRLRALEEGGLEVEEALRLLPEWGRLPDPERGTIRELASEAQESGRTVSQILQDQHEEMDREREKLRTERGALLKAREEDPEKSALRARVCELEQMIAGLKSSLNTSQTRLKYLSEAVMGCDRCLKQFAHLAFSDDKIVSEIVRDPLIKMLVKV